MTAQQIIGANILAFMVVFFYLCHVDSGLKQPTGLVIVTVTSLIVLTIVNVGVFALCLLLA